MSIVSARKKEEGGVIYLDLEELIKDSYQLKENVSISLTRWTMSNVTKITQPVAVNLLGARNLDRYSVENYGDYKTQFNSLINHILNHERIKIDLNSCMELGELTVLRDYLSSVGSFRKFFALGKDLLYIMKSIDKLLPSNGKKINLDINFSEIGDRNLIAEMQETEFTNFRLPSITTLSTLQMKGVNIKEAMEVIRYMKEEEPGKILQLDSKSCSGVAMSPTEMALIVKMGSKQGVIVNYTTDIQNNSKNTFINLYKDLYKLKFIKGDERSLRDLLELHLEMFGNQFMYSENGLYFQEVEIRLDSDKEGVVIKIQDNENEGYTTPIRKGELLETEKEGLYYIPIRNVNNLDVFIVHEVFFMDSEGKCVHKDKEVLKMAKDYLREVMN